MCDERPQPTLSDQDRALLALLQADLPLVPRPYQELARQLGMDEQAVLARVGAWQASGLVRRVAAVLHHQRAGFDANGMSVWVVPPARIAQVAAEVITFVEVGHCYERPTFAGWPYNLFAMLHGRTRDEVRAVARRISRRIGIDDYDILFTECEFKKVSMRYFIDELPDFPEGS